MKKTTKKSKTVYVDNDYKDVSLRGIISKIHKLDDELSKRQPTKALAEYNTGEVIHKKQVEFHKCQKRNRWVFGGNRSGKSECGAVEAVWLARGIHPYKENKDNIFGWVVSLSSQVQRDVAQAKILKYLNPYWIKDIVMLSGKKESPSTGIIDYIIIRNVFGGESRIGFKSCDQGREKFQGTSLDFVWFDEEPPFDIYMECKMRVLDRCGDIFGTMTPLKGLTWVYDTIYLNTYNDSEVWCIFMEWADNPYLSSKEIKSISASMSAEELESRRYGKFTSGGGLVYKDFDVNENIIDPFEVPIEWYDNISIDPGLHNPLSCHWYAVDYDGNVYVIAEHYASSLDIQEHSKRIKEISKSLNWPVNSNGMYSALIDSAATQKTLASSKSVAELFYDLGILVNTKVNKDLFSGISRVRSYIKDANGKRHLFIFRNCVNMIREIKGYFWGNDDAPVKRDDHAMDELRYYIMNRPTIPVKETAEPTLISKDKRKLMHRLEKRANYRF